MKYSAVGGGGSNGSSNRWRFKSTTVKAFMLCLFAFSAVFITYQLIYYMNLTEYQSQESHSRQLELLSGDVGGGIAGESKLSTTKSGKVEAGAQQQPKQKGEVNQVHFERGKERKKGKPLLSGRIIGVRPSDLHLYQDQQRTAFKCFTTSKKISWDKVNDDYCDCPLDGSDEPSTSACMSGKFYCLRKDGTKGTLVGESIFCPYICNYNYLNLSG